MLERNLPSHFSLCSEAAQLSQDSRLVLKLSLRFRPNILCLCCTVSRYKELQGWAKHWWNMIIAAAHQLFEVSHLFSVLKSNLTEWKPESEATLFSLCRDYTVIVQLMQMQYWSQIQDIPCVKKKKRLINVSILFWLWLQVIGQCVWVNVKVWGPAALLAKTHHSDSHCHHQFNHTGTKWL